MAKGIDRRTLLKSFGTAALALPFLELTRGEAYAQAGAPQRLVVFQHPMGMIMDAWRPTGGERDFVLHDILAPLEPFRDQLNIIDGVSNVVAPLNALSDGHNSAARTLMTCMPYHENLTADGSLLPQSQQRDDGLAGGPSIEQVIANDISASRRFKTIDFMIGGREIGQAQIFSAGRNDPVIGTADPRELFDRLFAEVAGNNETPIAKIRNKRGSVLDVVRQSYEGLSSRMGRADRLRLEAHTDKVRELEQRIYSGGRACSPPTVSLPGNYNPEASDFDDVSADILIEEAVMSLSCDLTRVVTLQFTNTEGPRFPWLGVDIPGRWSNWHTMIHEARNIGGRDAMVAAMTWYTQMFASLLQRMATTTDGNASLLENSLVLWISDFGEGDAHNTMDLPIILAGGLGGRLQTGRYLKFPGRTTGDLFTSILNLFGNPATCFGWNERCTGPLPGIA
ncbi:MAG: DUF1552 domain-containing protein [Deltaproteobacteria bacterium]